MANDPAIPASPISRATTPSGSVPVISATPAEAVIGVVVAEAAALETMVAQTTVIGTTEVETSVADTSVTDNELDAALERAISPSPGKRFVARPTVGVIGAEIATAVPQDGPAGEAVLMSMPRAGAQGSTVQHPWGQTWFSLMQQPWTSIVLVPAEPGLSTVKAAKALAEVGAQYQFEPIQVIDAGDLASGSVQGVLDTIQVFEGSEARLLIAVSSPLTHDAAIPSARAADGAVLVLRMGHTRTADAQRTIAAVGASHFIGAVALRD